MRAPLFLALLGVLLVAGCNDPAEPDTPTGVTPSGELAVTRLADLPRMGGNATDVAISQDNIIAVLDGKLYTLPASGGTPTLVNGDAEYRQIVALPSGEVYALTATDLRVFSNINAAPTTTSLDVGNRFVEGVRLATSPSGEVVVGINSYPGGLVLHTTADHGATWTPLPMPNGQPSLRYGTGFAFTSSGDLLVTNYEGLYKSSDRGATWTTLTASMSTFGSGFQIFVASNGDIYRYMSGVGNLGVSHNGGASFTDLTPYNQPPLILELREGEGGAIYATTVWGDLLRSTTGGTTWERVLLCGSCQAIETRGGTIVVGQGTKGGGVGGLFLSQNSGTEWATTGLAPVENLHDIGFASDGSLMLLAENTLFRKGTNGWRTLGSHGTLQRFASARGGELMMGGPTALYHSTDNGAHWRDDSLQGPPFGGPNDAPAMPTLIGRRNGGFILASSFINGNTRIATSTYLFDTDPFGRPRRINSPGNVERVVENAMGTLYTSTTFQDGITQQYIVDPYQSNDGGTTWQQLQRYSQGEHTAIAFNSANGYLSEGGSTGLRFSKAGQETPTELTLTGASKPYHIWRAWFGPDDKLYILTSDQGLLVSQGALK